MDVKKFENVLVASDYDGTLTDRRGEISGAVREALAYFIGEGGRFTVCTGRTKQGFHAYSPDLINAPVLLANGSMAYDYASGQTVMTDCITLNDFDTVKNVLEAFPEICVEFYTDDFRSFCVNPDEITLKHFSRQFIAYEVIDALSPDMFPLVKIMAGPGKKSFEFQRFLDESDPGGLRYIPSDGHFVELVSKTSGKGAGLLKLADVLGISKENVFSVGDGANDVDMHRVSACAFVPSNGDRRALLSADRIVRSNDCGAVAHVIEYLDSVY